MTCTKSTMTVIDSVCRLFLGFGHFGREETNCFRHFLSCHPWDDSLLIELLEFLGIFVMLN